VSYAVTYTPTVVTTTTTTVLNSELKTLPAPPPGVAGPDARVGAP
jgi:hypothetical protein